jgi:hypothetical protein
MKLRAVLTWVEPRVSGQLVSARHGAGHSRVCLLARGIAVSSARSGSSGRQHLISGTAGPSALRGTVTNLARSRHAITCGGGLRHGSGVSV